MVVYLVGARASGKTTIGKMVAARLGMDFTDTDALVVEKAGCEIADIVKNEGWEAFRARESEALAECARVGSTVVATGGGMVLAPANRDLMHATGTTFYLRAPAEVLAARLDADPLPGQRPSLTDKTLLDEVRTILAEREQLYQDAADHVIDGTGTLDENVADILKLLQGGAEQI